MTTRIQALAYAPFCVLCLLLAAMAPVVVAAAPEADGPGAARMARFVTDEATWVSVDVSPDGSTLVFDLLGTLYAMPIEGGRAQALTAPGMSWDFCPRFSPDGAQLAFLSNREGPTDVWVMEWRTRQMRRLTDVALWGEGDHSRYGFPCAPRWRSDGKVLATHNYARSGKQQAYYLAVPGGASQAITPQPHQDARHAFLDAVIPVLGREQAIAAYTVSSKQGRRRELFWLEAASGQANPLREAMAQGHAFAPELSPSGRLLAYMHRQDRGSNELRLRDLASGQERRLAPLPDTDDFVQETELPGYAFTPDERHVVMAYGGKLRKIAVEDGTTEVIPFQAEVVRPVAGRLPGTQRLQDGPVPLRAQRWPTLSDDRNRLAFSAAGAIWVRDLPGGTARPLGVSTTLNSMPALSADGGTVAYVAFPYTAEAIDGPGRLLLQPVDGAQAETVIDDDASYYWPTWSPDRTKLAVIRQAGRDAEAELGWVDLRARRFHPVATVAHYLGEDFRGNPPRWIAWSADGQRLRFQDFREWTHGYSAPLKLEEVRLDGSGRRTLAEAGMDVHAIVPSPDLKWAVVMGWDQNAYLVDLGDASSAPQRVSLDMPGIRRISTTGALYPRWSGGAGFTYGWMDRVFEYRLGDAAPKELAHTALTLPRRQGSGWLALRNARLITMAGGPGAGQVIERGTVLVQDRRIAAVGTVDAVQIPAGAKVIDATGMTIMPGLIDTHYHGIDPETVSFYAPGPLGGAAQALAFGITTPFEAGGGSVDDSAEDWRTVIETGRVPGPRWLFDSVHDGKYLHPDNAYESLADLHARFLRKRDLGQGPCIKEIADRDAQHSWRVAQAARATGACVVAHVEDHPFHGLARIAYGMALHHNIRIVPLYGDVAEFLLQADASWTPHMELQSDVDMPGDLEPRDSLPGLLAWLDRSMDDDDKQRFAHHYESHERYGPRLAMLRAGATDLFARSRRPPLVRDAHKLLERGMHMSLSGHDRFGPLRGEMDVWQAGGIPSGLILRAATLGGAEQLGLQRDLGSLEPGKIADLLVLKANPLDDVRNSIRLKWTVIDGLVYDSTRLEPDLQSH